ncbi:MAG: AraC family transcriptional regulator [Candidatus Thermochlorobacter sp.]
MQRRTPWPTSGNPMLLSYLNLKYPSLKFSPQLSRAIDYIRTHLSEPLTISQLCRHCCMSRANFFRAFKRATGLSPVTFINLERIKCASELIVQGYHTLADVCYQVGFSSVSYFIRIFKRYVGMTPAQYRALLQQNYGVCDEALRFSVTVS